MRLFVAWRIVLYLNKITESKIMNKVKILFKFLATAGPSIKSWVFADGKFQKSRAIILLLGFCLISASMYFFGVDNTAIALDMLDELSDIVGYVE